MYVFKLKIRDENLLHENAVLRKEFDTLYDQTIEWLNLKEILQNEIIMLRKVIQDNEDDFQRRIAEAE